MPRSVLFIKHIEHETGEHATTLLSHLPTRQAVLETALPALDDNAGVVTPPPIRPSRASWSATSAPSPRRARSAVAAGRSRRLRVGDLQHRPQQADRLVGAPLHEAERLSEPVERAARHRTSALEER